MHYSKFLLQPFFSLLFWIAIEITERVCLHCFLHMCVHLNQTNVCTNKSNTKCVSQFNCLSLTAPNNERWVFECWALQFVAVDGECIALIDEWKVRTDERLMVDRRLKRYKSLPSLPPCHHRRRPHHHCSFKFVISWLGLSSWFCQTLMCIVRLIEFTDFVFDLWC